MCVKVVERRAKALQELGRERGEDVKLLRKLLHEVTQLASLPISIHFNPSSTPPSSLLRAMCLLTRLPAWKPPWQG